MGLPVGVLVAGVVWTVVFTVVALIVGAGVFLAGFRVVSNGFLDGAGVVGAGVAFLVVFLVGVAIVAFLPTDIFRVGSGFLVVVVGTGVVVGFLSITNSAGSSKENALTYRVVLTICINTLLKLSAAAYVDRMTNMNDEQL